MISSQELIEELREHTGLDETDLDDEKALLLLNRSFWELLNKVKFKEKERSFVFPLSAGVRKYAVPTILQAIQGIALINNDTSVYTPLDKGGPWQYDNEYVDTVEERAAPTKYFRENRHIIFWPTPDVAYNVQLRYWINLSDLENNSDAPDVPAEWHEVILEGAVARAFMRGGDYNRAQKARDFQSSIVNNLDTIDQKEQDDTHRSHFDVEGYDGPQV